MAAEETIPAPKIEIISFPAKLSGSMEAMRDKLKAIPFYATDLEAGVLTLVKVESRNIRRQPYLFYVVEFKQGQMDVSYTIPQDMSEAMRRAVILKEVSSLVSMVGESYSIDEPKMLQYVDSTLDTLIKGLSQPYSTLFNQYNTMLGEYRALKRLNLELSSSNRNLAVQTEQLVEQNKKINEELKKLQKFSDESLMAMVVDWIEVHNSSIDIDEFAKNYGVGSPRVEEILDKMVSQGYLELKS